MKTITVKSTDGRTFWERSDDQPDGEVFVSGETAVQVTETTEVKKAIKNGRLHIVEATKKAEPKAEAKAEPKAEAKAKK